MTKFVAFLNDGCLDPECNAPAKRHWDSRAVYCNEYCMVADGHIVTSQNHDDSHGMIGIYGFPLEPNSCEHCSYCGEKVVQGIECDFECDEACIAAHQDETDGERIDRLINISEVR